MGEAVGDSVAISGGGLVRPVFRTPLLIDPLMAGHTKQPGTRRIQFAELTSVGQRLGIDGLQEVIGGIAITAVPDQETAELVPVVLPGRLDAGLMIGIDRHTILFGRRLVRGAG
nr:hypothetical protein [Halomonas sp. KAO]